jgi:toxin ParE1/3/4
MADLALIQDALTVKAGVLVAAKFALNFQNLFDRLADHPDSCPARRRLGKGIRMGVVVPYLVFYRHDASQSAVNIMRVIHGKRRVTRKMLTDC